MKMMCAAMAAILCVAGPAFAREEDYSQEDLGAAMAFAMGDATYTMYHEIGHMMVSELGLPVLGKEEDAADALAVLMLLNDDSDTQSYVSLIDATDGWYFNAVNSTGSGVEDFSYYSDHSLDIQRAYAMACLMLGKDAGWFSAVGDFYEIDEQQRQACAVTYEQAETSWNSVLEPHLIEDEPGAEIEVIYEDAGGYEQFAEALKERGVLEHAAELITSTYVLPRPIVFRAALCDMPNAFYSPSDGEVVYCYELAEDLFNLYLSDVIYAYKAGEDEAE